MLVGSGKVEHDVSCAMGEHAHVSHIVRLINECFLENKTKECIVTVSALDHTQLKCLVATFSNITALSLIEKGVIS